MAKKSEKAQDLMKCCSWKEGLYFACAVFFSALGVALLVEGLLGQWNIGFRAGLVSYILAFLSFGIAKCCKRKSCLNNCN